MRQGVVCMDARKSVVCAIGYDKTGFPGTASTAVRKGKALGEGKVSSAKGNARRCFNRCQIFRSTLQFTTALPGNFGRPRISTGKAWHMQRIKNEYIRHIKYVIYTRRLLDSNYQSIAFWILTTLSYWKRAVIFKGAALTLGDTWIPFNIFINAPGISWNS